MPKWASVALGTGWISHGTAQPRQGRNKGLGRGPDRQRPATSSQNPTTPIDDNHEALQTGLARQATNLRGIVGVQCVPDVSGQSREQVL